MRCYSIKVLFLLLLLGLSHSAEGQDCGKNEYAVSGEVLKWNEKSKEYEPLDGVTITLERGSDVPRQTMSKLGRYQICFPRGVSIDLLTYEMADWNPNHVKDLSGARNHSIKMTLKQGVPKSSLELEELLSTLTLIYLVRERRGEEGIVRERYRKLIQEISERLDPELRSRFSNRLEVIRTLYGVR